MRIKVLILIILSIFIAKQANAQQFKAVAQLDTFQIEIGDQVYLKFIAIQQADKFVEFPKFKKQIIDGIDIISISQIDTVQSASKEFTLSQSILITSFDDSLFNIPAFPFISDSDTIYSNSISFDVHMVKIDSATISKIDTNQVLRIFDVKKPIDTPWTFTEFLKNYYLYIIGIILIAILSFLTYYFIKRYKENKPIFKISKPKEPAHVTALRELNKLKERKLWQTGKEKAYYSELTHILRKYIENRFHVSALDRTSHEVLELLKHANIIEKEQLNELSQIFKMADLAKFAKFRPLAHENDLNLKNAFSIIENTIPVVETSETEKEENENNTENKIIESKNSEKEEK